MGFSIVAEPPRQPTGKLIWYPCSRPALDNVIPGANCFVDVLFQERQREKPINTQRAAELEIHLFRGRKEKEKKKDTPILIIM